MSEKAIILKGPSSDSKSYFTGLPKTLDELIQKAGKLFPVPPNHTGHLLLEGDAILMPDVLPFLKDREVLTFKWTANTPRSSLRQTSKVAEELARQASSSGGSSSSGSTHGNGRSNRGVRWDASVLANEEPTAKNATALNQIESARPYRYSAAGRAEHSRRVLGEQEERRRNEHASGQPSRTDDVFTSKECKGRLSSEQSGKTAQKMDIDELPKSSPQTMSHSGSSVQDCGESSPASQSHVSPPTSYSASGSTDRERMQSDEEQQNSSPIASPTRHIRGAQKSQSEWTTPLGSDKIVDFFRKTVVEEVSEKQDEQKGRGINAVQVDVKNAAGEQALKVDHSMTGKVDAAEVPEAITSAPVRSECIVSKNSPASDKDSTSEADARIDTSYTRMAAVIDALRNHPSNQHFRLPLEQKDQDNHGFIKFLRQTGRPIIDFSTIMSNVTRRGYGQQDPFAGFGSELGQMWSNTRSFYGPASPQAQCAEFLDRFSRIIMIEWRRDKDVRVRGKGDSTSSSDNKQDAMARAAKLMHNMTYGHASSVLQHKKHVPNSDGKRPSAVAPVGGKGQQARLVNQNHASQPNARASLPSQEQKSTQKLSSPSRQGTLQPKGTASRDTRASDGSYTPRTHAFLSSMFAKTNGAVQPTSATASMMAKLQHQFGPTPTFNADATRKSVSPSGRQRTYHIPSTPIKQNGSGAKRTAAVPPEDHRSAKRVHVEDKARQASTPSCEVPKVTVTEGSESATAANDMPMESQDPKNNALSIVGEKGSEASEMAKPSEDESAVELATGVQSPPSVAKRVRDLIVNASLIAEDGSASVDSPRRRSPRRVTPTRKARESEQTHASSLPTAVATDAEASKARSPKRKLKPGSATSVATENVPQHPPRMMTRGVAAAMGTPRRSRLTATAV